MKTVTVTASKNYDVIIGNGVQAQIGDHLKQLGYSNVAIISDSNVWPIYGKQLLQYIEEAGIRYCSYVFPAGESSKNGETYLKILDFLAQNRLTRSDALIALGGGVVGDITGFAAATFLRGIAFIQVPTSLLAMVDSSVGGKTAIDLPAGKNLAGAFCQPSLVLCDLETLQTLPEKFFRDGCAEIIKYGVLFDPALFSHLMKIGFDFDKEAVVSRCVELKRDIVNLDEFDRGARQKLNLGHTIGHSIEVNSNFTITHGEAVAAGMAIISKAGYAFGMTEKKTYLSIMEIIKKFQLPTSANANVDLLYNSALSDKKRSGDTINLIVPCSIGNCCIYPIESKMLKSFIEAGL